MAMGSENLMTTKAALIVGTAGHVWVAALTKQDDSWLHLTRARIVRVWGTDAGLNQLVDGPRTETVLDRSAPIVSVAWHAVIAVIPVDNSAWERHL